MGGRRLGGYTHTEALDTISGEAQIWFDHPDYGSPQHAPFSILQELTSPLPLAPQALSGAGAVSSISYKTDWTTTGANAGTLGDGQYIGQEKVIQLIVYVGDGTLTPTTLDGGTTIVFGAVGDTAHLVWTVTGWVAIDLYNRADGATAPVLA